MKLSEKRAEGTGVISYSKYDSIAVPSRWATVTHLWKSTCGSTWKLLVLILTPGCSVSMVLICSLRFILALLKGTESMDCCNCAPTISASSQSMLSSTFATSPETIDIRSALATEKGLCSSSHEVIVARSSVSLIRRLCERSTCCSEEVLRWLVSVNIASFMADRWCIVNIQVFCIDSVSPRPWVRPPWVFNDAMRHCSMTKSVHKPFKGCAERWMACRPSSTNNFNKSGFVTSSDRMHCKYMRALLA